MALVVLLSAFWYVLSGRIGLQYLVFMVSSVGLVLWLNPERPFPGLDPTRGRGLSGFFRGIPHLLRYLAWLVWNVITANIEVARIILDPRLPIDPGLVTFDTRLKSPLARVVVANSITLTPGTVTVDLEDQSYLVHQLTPSSADAVATGSLQNVVGAIFGEARDPAPEVRPIHDIADFHP